MEEGRHDGLEVGAEFDFVTDGLPKRSSRMKFLNVVIGRKFVSVPERDSVLHIGRPPKKPSLGAFAPECNLWLLAYTRKNPNRCNSFACRI